MTIASRYVNRILSMTPEQRQRLRLKPRSGVGIGRLRLTNAGGKSAYVGSRERDHLVKWARDRGVRFRKSFRAVAKVGVDPGERDIVRVFGSWRNFSEAVGPYAEMDIPFDPRMEPARILDIVSFKRLWTRKEYNQFRKMFPGLLLPSEKKIVEYFGGWKQMAYLAQRCRSCDILNIYIEIRDRIGRWPTLPQCEDFGLDISVFTRIHGSKDAFDNFLDSAFAAFGKPKKWSLYSHDKAVKA